MEPVLLLILYKYYIYLRAIWERRQLAYPVALIIIPPPILKLGHYDLQDPTP
jgi:hypothetical protein